jgi:CheY-like chemotaxis protein
VTSRQQRLIAEFLSAVSHDLRTPLAVIVGYAELIASRDDEATRREGSERILEAAERLAGGIENVVTLFETGAALGAGTIRPLRPDPSDGRVRQVLCADEDQALRELLAITFPETAFGIAETTRADEALALAKADRPDLVLLGWRLGGADVLRELKAHDGTIPVIVVAEESDGEGRREAQRLGADAWLTKPCSPLELFATAEHLLTAQPG